MKKPDHMNADVGTAHQSKPKKRVLPEGPGTHPPYSKASWDLFLAQQDNKTSDEWFTTSYGIVNTVIER